MSLPSDRTLPIFQWALGFLLLAAVAHLIGSIARFYLFYQGAAP